MIFVSLTFLLLWSDLTLTKNKVVIQLQCLSDLAAKHKMHNRISEKRRTRRRKGKKVHQTPH